MLRLFTGLALPAPVRDRLALLQGGIPGARWIAPEDYHITLTFIGAVDEAAAEDIDAALGALRLPGFALTLRGTGSFARGDNDSHLWIGVEAEDGLTRLKEKIDQTLLRLRLPFENRKYTPHVTVARLRHSREDRVAAFMQAHNLFTTGPIRVEEFALYRSHQGKKGAHYAALATYPLGA